MYRTILTAVLIPICSTILNGQDIDLKANATEVQITPGDTFQLSVKALDADGTALDDVTIVYYTSNGKFAESDENGLITAFEPGQAKVIVIARQDEKEGFSRLDVPVYITYAKPASITLSGLPDRVHQGQTLELNISVKDEKGFEIVHARPEFSLSDAAVASVDDFGNVTAGKAGTTNMKVTYEHLSTSVQVTVEPNPVAKIELAASHLEARSGDIIQFASRALDARGNELTGLSFTYTFQGKSSNPSDYASGMIRSDGRFVGDVPGTYTISSSYGGTSARKSVRVVPREVTEQVQLIGRGAVSDVHTSDLWVWEGVDGRDYCVTGTWGGNGEAFFWDVTDPSSITLIDTITVDARTVNDVKVSEDGRICIISREGASNRKNGLVIIDVTNPRDAKIISTFNDGLTGGVHNLFIYKDHVYALSNGERYDIINIEDPTAPYKVGEFELEGPGHSIHDVWIEDGIAYSSNWDYGVYMVDVGNGVAGGSPAYPKVIGSYAYPSGWNHAAFPYKDEQTGKFYVIAGDEAFPNGLHVDDNPTIPAGYLHFVDFTDRDNPEEVAKYEVPGAGSHNFWVDGDVLYVANYNAGLRVVDISGDLMGDLYKQGREIAWFLPTDPDGRIPNAPMTWGPQPHKGHIFFSDWNSGLWSVKVKTPKPAETTVESR